AMTGLRRNGAIAPGGSCRILPCADGHVAVNLARDSDWQSLDAWLQTPTNPDWDSVMHRVRGCDRNTLIERARLLELAVVDAQPGTAEVNHWFAVNHAVARARLPSKPARVIDLSSLWAGPLCGLLLQQVGCEVIKVQGSQRPDGARLGSPAFFDFLNGGKQQLTLDLHTTAGRHALRELLQDADIIIESSRPRALRQMGIHAEQLLQEIPGLTWVSITGYGRQEPEANWIAYGDDAGVAAGLSALMHTITGRWMFCGDAIADPLTGIHAALAALADWRTGGGRLLSLSLVGTVQFCITYSNNVRQQTNPDRR
ncbi:MAG: CoA transferase, partial [Halioglobus sp.]|nr:CoA transferase [Halioglobus sp.]